MYNLIDAKLLVLPDWLDKALQAHNLKPINIMSKSGLESILSPHDVEYYQNQITALVTAVSGGSGYNPVKAILNSLTLMHSNSASFNHLGNEASGNNEYVKINALYGKKQSGYDFFNGANMLGFIPRNIAATLVQDARVYPYIERIGTDSFALKFTLEPYAKGNEEIQFIDPAFRMLLSEYGFDKLAVTKLFDYRTLLVSA